MEPSPHEPEFVDTNTGKRSPVSAPTPPGKNEAERAKTAAGEKIEGSGVGGWVQPKRYAEGREPGSGLATIGGRQSATYEEIEAKITDLALTPRAKGRMLSAQVKCLEILAKSKGILVERSIVGHVDLRDDKTGRTVLMAELARVGIRVVDLEALPAVASTSEGDTPRLVAAEKANADADLRGTSDNT